MHKPAFFIFKSVLARERSTAPYTRSLGTSQGDRNPFRNARRTNAIGHRLGIQSVSKYFLGLDEEFHMWGAPHNSGITTWSVSGTNLWVPDAELACFGRQTMNYQAYFNPWYTHVKLSDHNRVFRMVEVHTWPSLPVYGAKLQRLFCVA